MKGSAMDTVSAVIPAYNAESCIERAVASVLSQTRPVIEVLVVDDGSRDNTAAIVERFGSPVRLIRQANAGPSAARNHGVRAASGEWIALLDADDAWLPTKLERQAPLFDDPRTGAVHCYVVNVAERFRYEGPLTFEMLWERNRIGTSTAVVRRATWEALGGFDEDPELIGIEDYNFWLRMLGAGWGIARCAEELSEYTPAADSLSTQVERMTRAELHNARKIAAVLGLSADVLQRKEADIYAEYGFSLLYARDRHAARRCLANVLLRRPTVSSLTHWMATFVPTAVLDWRRAVYGAGSRRTA